MKEPGIKLYYEDGLTKIIRFDGPMTEWYRHMRLQWRRPIGINVFVGSDLVAYKEHILKYILKHKKGIIMGMHPEDDCHGRTRKYLDRLEQELLKVSR